MTSSAYAPGDLYVSQLPCSSSTAVRAGWYAQANTFCLLSFLFLSPTASLFVFVSLSGSVIFKTQC